MKNLPLIARFIKPHEALVLAIGAIMLIGAALSGSGENHSLASVEVQFTDTSIHGLHIVPASCPSYPHYSGDCSVIPSGCGPGTLNDQCANCTGSACGGGTPTCPDGSPMPSNGVCTGTASLCPDGSPMPSNGVCTGTASFCPDGSRRPANGICSQARSCIASVSCGNSTTIHYVDSSCAVSDVACPQYWTCGAGACIPPEGPKIQSFAAILPNGKSFTASGHLEAHPTLVRTGDSTTLYWNVVNVASCTITSSDGGSWSCSGGSSACSSGVYGRGTSAIANQVTYTLACNALPGATPRSFGESIKVDVVPTYQEQ